MKKTAGICLFPIAIIFFWSLHLWASTVNVEIIHSQDRYQIGGAYPLLLRLKIKEPWYIHGPADKGSGLIPTVLSFRHSPVIKVEEITFPKPEKKKFDYTSNPVEVYSGLIPVRATLRISKDTPLGEHVITGNLSYQACSSEVCLPPENIPLTITVSAVPEGSFVTALNRDLFYSIPVEEDAEIEFPGIRPGTSLLFILLGIFLGGLALNLTPCIYPLIPITVSYFGGKSETVYGRVILHGILYIFGLAVTNSVLGVSSALSGGMLGAALQNPAVLLVIACIMLALGFSFFGFWELRLPGAVTKMASKRYSGYLGTFFMGLTLGVVAAPCLGPFILGLLVYVGQLGDPFLGFLYFFVLSIGMGLPLSVLAVFSGAIDRLPVSGDWMVWVRRFMGWVLVAMAMYIISPLISSTTVKSILFSAVIIFSGIHLGWLDKTGKGHGRFIFVKQCLSILIILCGFLYLGSAIQKKEGIHWIPYDPEILMNAAQNRMPVLLDFYADWCLPCKELDHRVFNDPEVVALSRNFIAVRLDLTRQRDLTDEARRQYQVYGVPTVVFINREGIEEKSLRIESLVNKPEFLDKMKRLLEESPPAQR